MVLRAVLAHEVHEDADVVLLVEQHHGLRGASDEVGGDGAVHGVDDGVALEADRAGHELLEFVVEDVAGVLDAVHDEPLALVGVQGVGLARVGVVGEREDDAVGPGEAGGGHDRVDDRIAGKIGGAHDWGRGWCPAGSGVDRTERLFRECPFRECVGRDAASRYEQRPRAPALGAQSESGIRAKDPRTQSLGARMPSASRFTPSRVRPSGVRPAATRPASVRWGATRRPSAAPSP